VQLGNIFAEGRSLNSGASMHETLLPRLGALPVRTSRGEGEAPGCPGVPICRRGLPRHEKGEHAASATDNMRTKPTPSLICKSARITMAP
jgi:hypothetical protein